MAAAWVGHVVSAIVTMTASSYTQIYIGTTLFALSNGIVEAVTNPAVATLYPKDKVRYLNILHAGWPGGPGLRRPALHRHGRYVLAIEDRAVPAAGRGLRHDDDGLQVPGAGACQRGRVVRRHAQGVRLGGRADRAVLRGRRRRCRASRHLQLGTVDAGVLGHHAHPDAHLRREGTRARAGRCSSSCCSSWSCSATTELGTDSWVTDLLTPVLRGQRGVGAGLHLGHHVRAAHLQLRSAGQGADTGRAAAGLLGHGRRSVF